MLRLALEGIPYFKITTVSMDREGPSFTIDALRALQTDDVQFYLLLADDSAAHLDMWKEAGALIQLAPPLVGSRTAGQGIIKTKVSEISSSEVRQRLRAHLYCGHLVPSNVLKYIQMHHLYI